MTLCEIGKDAWGGAVLIGSLLVLSLSTNVQIEILYQMKMLINFTYFVLLIAYKFLTHTTMLITSEITPL